MSYQTDGSEVKTHGLNKFFSVLIHSLLKIILLNLLFIVTAIVVVTLPVAISSCVRVLQKLIAGEDVKVCSEYFASFRKNFGISLAYGWSVSVLMIGLLYGTYFYFANGEGAPYLYIGMAICVVLFVIVYASAIFGFAMIARVKLSYVQIIKNSFLLMFVKPLYTLLGTVFSLAVLFAGVWFFPYSIPLLVLIVFALTLYIGAFSSVYQINKYVAI